MHVAVVEPGAIRTPIWDKGRSTADQLEATLPAGARQLYGEGFDKVRGLIDQQENDGIPPERVATAVDHALFAKRPRYRYLVGTDARVAGNLAADPARQGDGEAGGPPGPLMAPALLPAL